MEGDQFLPMKRRKESIPSTIYSLSEDLILTIFLCLPSLATLIRAAFTCRAWRRLVASSPGFRRRFLEIHQAPLLGFFFDAPTILECPDFPNFPSFVPVRHRDRDLAAVVRGSDFFLTSIQEHLDKIHCWGIADCCRGYILLTNGDDDSSNPMALLNPLVKRGEQFIDDGHENAFEGYNGCPMECKACLIFSAEHPNASFKVVRLIYDESRVRATVFSSDTGEWSILPWVKVPGRPHRTRGWLLSSNMQTNGFVYWIYRNHEYLITLDTTTMNFSVEELPEVLRGRNCCFEVGETSTGTPCIFYTIGFNIGMLWRRIDSDGVEKWILGWTTPFEIQLGELFGPVLRNYDEVQVVAVKDGIVYLATSRKFQEVQMSSWFFTLSLETMKMEKLFERTYDSRAHPYIMAWPPSLAGNFGRFALEDDA